MSELDRDRRFGTVAVEMGYVTLDQVLTAMNIQVREDIVNGEHKLPVRYWWRWMSSKRAKSKRYFWLWVCLCSV